MNTETIIVEHQNTSKTVVTAPKFVALNVKNTIKVVTVDDIVYLESSGRYTTLSFKK